MNKTYIILIAVAVVLAIGILLMDKQHQPAQADAGELIVEINDPSRFLSVDVIADRIVKKDPSLVVIDLRPADQYKIFTIPGAINIPLDSLLTTWSMDILESKQYDKVLFSNSDAWADQAWLVCRRLDTPNVFVLEGGVNRWFSDIAKPVAPPSSAPQEEFDLYSFRMAANQHFYGSAELPKEVKKEAKKIQPVRKEPEAATGGGC